MNAPYDPLKELAARIELHLTMDAVGSGYSLSTEDQRTIIDALRFASAWYAGDGCCPQCQERGPVSRPDRVGTDEPKAGQ